VCVCVCVCVDVDGETKKVSWSQILIDQNADPGCYT
jgi:hypothetical protein